MPTLRASRLALFTFALSCISCSHKANDVFISLSPNRRMRFVVESSTRYPSFEDVMRFVVRGAATKTVYEWRRKDVHPCFVDAGWSADSRYVIVIFRDCYHEPARQLAFDALSGQALDPKPLVALLAGRIRKDYKLSESTDPILWAQQNDAAFRFTARRGDSLAPVYAE